MIEAKTCDFWTHWTHWTHSPHITRSAKTHTVHRALKRKNAFFYMEKCGNTASSASSVPAGIEKTMANDIPFSHCGGASATGMRSS